MTAPADGPKTVAGPAADPATAVDVVVGAANEHAVRTIEDALRGTRFHVVATVDDAVAAVRASTARPAAVCLLEVGLPRGGGIWAAHRITRSAPGRIVVMLAATEDHDDLLDAVRAGATGYLVVDRVRRRLPDALAGVLAGEAAVPRGLVARLVEEVRAHGAPHQVAADGTVVRLTAREHEVLELLRRGSSTGDMAAALFVSPVTVRTHVAAILRKLRVEDRKAAVATVEAQRRRRSHVETNDGDEEKPTPAS